MCATRGRTTEEKIITTMGLVRMHEYRNKPEAFPQNNGHTAWSYASKTLEEAAIEDLFWRKVQGTPTFAWEVVMTVWPGPALGKWDVLIVPVVLGNS